MNYNNFAQKTNWVASSPAFENVPFYLTSVNIPGMNFSNPEVGGRSSSRIKLNADTITFNSLSFDMMVDEDMLVYKEFMSIIRDNIQVPEGTFEDFNFEFWVELNNNKGNSIMKLEFHNCRLSSISDIILDTQDESTEFLLSVEVDYDYYEIVDTGTSDFL